MQTIKQFQSDISIVFMNPLYAVLLELCPWLKRAKQNKATSKKLAKASLRSCCVATCAVCWLLARGLL